MARHVAFLRGMNVGGHRITNDALVGHVAALGFVDVRTFRASGNVILGAPEHAAPGVIARLGFDYAALAKQNPRLIYLSTSLLGQNGPYVKLAGFGNLGAALSGIAFYAISGIWTKPTPGGPDYLRHFGSWTVAFLPGFAALLVEKDRRP